MTSKMLSLNLGFLTLHGLLRGYLMTAGRRGACQPVPVWALQLAACPVLIRKGLPAPRCRQDIRKPQRMLCLLQKAASGVGVSVSFSSSCHTPEIHRTSLVGVTIVSGSGWEAVN